MDTNLEQNQIEDDTIQQMSTIKFDESLNITVIMGDDEDNLEGPVSNQKNVRATTNNPTKNHNILHEVETNEHILKQKHNKKSCEAISDSTNNTNNAEYTPMMNYAIATVDPLEIVSDNLINYIKLYSFYQSHYVNQDSTSKRLKYIKELYFCLSYHITMEHIFPKENEQDFLINFVWKTRERSKMNISHISLFNILSELLQWTKQKCIENENKMRQFKPCHNNESNVIDSNKQEIRNPNFEVTANKKNSNISNISNSNTIKTGHPKINSKNTDIRTDGKLSTCLFTSSEPGKEISIHIDTETLDSLYNVTKQKSKPETIRKQPRKRKSDHFDTVPPQQQPLPSNSEKPFHIVKEVVRSMFFPTEEKSEKLQVKIWPQTNKNLSNMSNIANPNISNYKNSSKNYKTKTYRNATTCLFTASKPGQELSININTEPRSNLENITKNKSDLELQRKRTKMKKSNEIKKTPVLQKLLTDMSSDKTNAL